MLNRRTFLTTAAAAALTPRVTQAGQFSGKIRKSLMWGMAQKAAQGMSLREAFKKLRACGYEAMWHGAWTRCWIFE